MKIKLLAALIAACLVIAVLSYLLTVDRKQPAIEKADIGKPPSPLLADFAEYFPTNPGRRWVYDIQIPDPDRPPLTHYWIHSTQIPSNSGEVRGRRFHPLMTKLSDGKIKLILSLVGLAPASEMLTYPENHELRIERDDLGLYEGYDRLYWGIEPIQWRDGDYCVTEHVIFKPEDTNRARTFSVKSLFFRDPVSGGELEAKGENEKLVFVGKEDLDGLSSVRFRRVVETRALPPDLKVSREDLYMSSSFQEDVWFAKGVGLVKLVQVVNGRPTMVWTLER